MSSNKAKNTKPEILLRKELWKHGVRGYRLHYKDIPGRPDIAFIKPKLAVFVNGCFWHRCPNCNLSIPKNNAQFWKEKFHKNIQRDALRINQLTKIGWKVIVAWECELKTNINKYVAAIISALSEKIKH